MTVSWFVLFQDSSNPDARVADDDLAVIRRIVAATPGLQQALLYQPEHASDPYLDDGAPPLLGLQLDFADIAVLEAALGPHGHLQALAVRDDFPSLARASAHQQAMVTRRFPVSDPAFQTPAGQPFCTYLVAYEGAADDLPAWLAYYIAHHPPIMARFPGIRGIEIYTRLDWCGALPWPRADCMQRNKVVFDSPAALTAALNSPVRHDMRADFKNFPPFTGRNTHYPMATRVIPPD